MAKDVEFTGQFNSLLFIIQKTKPFTRASCMFFGDIGIGFAKGWKWAPQTARDGAERYSAHATETGSLAYCFRMNTEHFCELQQEVNAQYHIDISNENNKFNQI